MSDTISALDHLVGFTEAMRAKLIERHVRYGNTWETMTLQELRKKLDAELQELDESLADKGAASWEAVDLANVCLFLWVRLGLCAEAEI